MNQITFTTDKGGHFKATLVGSTLKDIERMNGAVESTTMPGGGTETGSGEKSEPTQSEPERGGTTPPLAKPDRIFVEQLKAVLVNNRARKQLRHKQRGILDTRKLVQTQLDSTAVWRQNNRKESERNYSVLLLVDESGSMQHDDKHRLAQDITQRMVASLDEVGGVETAVIGFSGNRLIEHKRFDNTGENSLDAIVDATSRRKTTQHGRQIADIAESDGENADLIAMEYGLDYLRKKASPKSRPVFIMLSDGAPCESPSNITVVTADMKRETFRSVTTRKVENTRRIEPMHALIRKSPDILCFGLGMLRGGQQVPRHKVVENLTDTRKELVAFLRNALK